MRFGDFVERLDDYDGKRMARCPSHEDRQRSLQVSERDNGDIGLHCHAGCTPLAVVSALGLDLKDLFAEAREPNAIPDEIEAIYTYTDAGDRPVFEVVRFRGKKFRQRLHGSPEGEWGLKGLDNKPLFHLPQLLAADPNRRVWVVEGEKDVLAIERAGGIATCNVGGAGKWHTNYSHQLRGLHIRIVADKDEPGIAHAAQVLQSVEGVAASVEVVQARQGKDASDHLKNGGTLDDFVAVPVGLDGLLLTRFDVIDAEEVVWIEGWEGFFPYSGLTSLVGMPGVNKSTLTCRLMAEVTRKGQQAMIIASEDSIGKVVRPRLEAAGADLSRCILVKRQFGKGQGHITFPTDAEALLRNVEREEVGIVVVDPIDAHLSHDVAANAYNNPMIRSALAPLAEVADATGAAVIMVGHPNKNRSSDPMMRAGGSIGIPGAARSALLMGNHPDVPESAGSRVLASYKGNWADRPKSRAFSVEVALAGKIMSIRLVDRGETHLEAWALLKKGTNERET